MEAESLKDALRKFQCEFIVPYHTSEFLRVLKISCHQYMGILDVSLKAKNCAKAVADYVHPVCGHRSLGPSCHRRRQWENKPIMCKVAVDHIRSCGCEVRPLRHGKVQECPMVEALICQEAVSRPFPFFSLLWSSRGGDEGQVNAAQDGEFGGEGGQGGSGEVLARAQADGGEDKVGPAVDAGRVSPQTKGEER